MPTEGTLILSEPARDNPQLLHSNRKADLPSGTTITFASALFEALIQTNSTLPKPAVPDKTRELRSFAVFKQKQESLENIACFKTPTHHNQNKPPLPLLLPPTPNFSKHYSTLQQKQERKTKNERLHRVQPLSTPYDSPSPSPFSFSSNIFPE
jgi:hypothetical protein